MNILICSVDYKPNNGGIAEFTYNVASSLSKLGQRIYVLAPYKLGGKEFDERNKEFITYRTKGVVTLDEFSYKNILFKLHLFFAYICNAFKIYRNIKEIIEERKIGKIICFHWDVYGIIALLLSKKTKFPFYIVGYGLEISPKSYSLKAILQRAVLRNASAVFAISNYTKERILRYNSSINKIFVTYCGVDPQKFYKRDTNMDLVEKYHLQNKKILLTVARLVGRKGIDNSIKAFYEYSRKYPSSNAIYLIGGDGPDKSRLKRLVEELSLQDKVIFLGFIPEDMKNDYYNLANIFIMPSREEANGDVEGFGIVYLEANCCEKPVIGGNSGGVSCAIKDGYSGLLADPLNVNDILEKMEKLLNDKEYALRLGKQGRERTEAEFIWQKVALRFMQGIQNSENSLSLK